MNIAGLPVIAGDRLIVGNGDNALIALSLKDDSCRGSTPSKNFESTRLPLWSTTRFFLLLNAACRLMPWPTAMRSGGGT